jgi:hypothetical protein
MRCRSKEKRMSYRFENMKDIIEKYQEDEIRYACDLMNLDYEDSFDKAALVSLLETGQKNYVSEIFYMLSHEDLMLIQIMKENEGVFEFRDDTTLEEGPPRELESLSNLLDLCLIQPDIDLDEEGMVRTHMSREFLDTFQVYLEPERLSMAGYLDEAAKIIQGVLYYYGAVEIDVLYDMVSRNHGISRDMFNRVLGYKHALTDSYAPIFLGDVEYIADLDFDLHYHIEDVKRWNKGQGYREYSRNELLEASEPSFVEKKEDYEKILEYFKKYYRPDPQFVAMYPNIPEDFYYNFHVDKTIEMGRKSHDLGQVLSDFFQDMDFSEEEELKAGTKLMLDYLNGISKWENLGYAHDEMPKLKMENTNVVHMKAYVGKRRK